MIFEQQLVNDFMAKIETCVHSYKRPYEFRTVVTLPAMVQINRTVLRQKFMNKL